MFIAFVSSARLASRRRGTNEPATMAPKWGLRAGNLIDVRSFLKQDEEQTRVPKVGHKWCFIIYFNTQKAANPSIYSELVFGL